MPNIIALAVTVFALVFWIRSVQRSFVALDEKYNMQIKRR